MKKHSLYNVILVVFVIMAVISSISIYFSSVQYKKDLLETAIEEKTHLAEVVNEFTGSSAMSLQISSFPDLESDFIDEMARFKDVIYIRIIKPGGEIYQSSIKEELGENINDLQIAKVLSSKTIVMKDEFFKGQKIKTIIYPGYGDRTIWIGFSLESMEKSTNFIFFREIVTSIGGLLSTILVMFLVLRAIINPLKRMALSFEEMRKGNFSVKIETKTKDEIGKLADNFNEMIKDLEESKVTLEEEKNTL